MSNFYMPLNTGEYLRDTGSLSQGQHGAYMLLLMHQWDTRKALPLEKEACYRIARAHSREEKKNVDEILQKYFKQNQHGFTNSKVSKMLKAKRKISEKRAEAGAKGGKQTASKRLSKRPSKNQGIYNNRYVNNPLTPKGGMEGFKKFKALYPKQYGMKAAEAFWKANQEELEPQTEDILRGVQRWMLTDQWTKKSGQFITAPKKFLEEGFWKGGETKKMDGPWQRLLKAEAIRHTVTGQEAAKGDYTVETPGWIRLPGADDVTHMSELTPVITEPEGDER